MMAKKNPRLPSTEPPQALHNIHSISLKGHKSFFYCHTFHLSISFKHSKRGSGGEFMVQHVCSISGLQICLCDFQSFIIMDGWISRFGEMMSRALEDERRLIAYALWSFFV